MLGYAVFAEIMLRLALQALEVLVMSCSNSNSGNVSREISNMVIEWEIFLNVMTKKQEPPFFKSCTRFAILTSSKPGTSRDENIRQFLSNDTLHLFVHHTREFTSSKRSAGYSTVNNVTLDTVQCAYTIHIYKSTFARSADRCVCSPLSLVLSALSLPSLFLSLSLSAPLKSELSFSRFLELSLVT